MGAKIHRPLRTRCGVMITGVLLIWSSLSGCVEAPNRMVVELSASGINVSDELDTLELTITGSRTASGDDLCAPETIVYSLDTTDSSHITLPFTLEIVPGKQFDKLVYVRVVGRHFGTVRFKNERMGSLTGGDSRLHVAITADCLGVGTGAGQHCQGGIATESPYWRIFDEGQYVDSSEKCSAE